MYFFRSFISKFFNNFFFFFECVKDAFSLLYLTLKTLFHHYISLVVSHALQVLLFVFLLDRQLFLFVFSNALPRGEYVNVAFILLWSDDNVSAPVTYSYLSIFPDDNADTFAASLLISYCIYSSIILSSTVMINFYILSKRFFLKRKRLSDAKVVSITKNNKVLQYTFYKDS